MPMTARSASACSCRAAHTHVRRSRSTESATCLSSFGARAERRVRVAKSRASCAGTARRSAGSGVASSVRAGPLRACRCPACPFLVWGGMRGSLWDLAGPGVTMGSGGQGRSWLRLPGLRLQGRRRSVLTGAMARPGDGHADGARSRLSSCSIQAFGPASWIRAGRSAVGAPSPVT